MCVLVVDDEIKILRFIKLSLTLAGYAVITATNGADALKLLESEKPDIMLLDLIMPGMDGFEVLRRTRAISGLPVIVFSAHDSASGEALSLGANDFLAKPFSSGELVNKIEAIAQAVSKNG
ncbi:MAG: response regulator [Chloroflexota bacterium]